MDRNKLDLAKADFELACRERQKKIPCTNDMCEECELKVSIECIDKALSQPERKHGYWISEEPYCKELGGKLNGFIYKCSRCGTFIIAPYKYCPECGTKMDGKDESDGTRD